MHVKLGLIYVPLVCPPHFVCKMIVVTRDSDSLISATVALSE